MHVQADAVLMATEGVLSARKLRKIRRITGIDATRGWAWHPYWEFRDAADRHYTLNTHTGRWREIKNPMHYTSCRSS